MLYPKSTSTLCLTFGEYVPLCLSLKLGERVPMLDNSSRLNSIFWLLLLFRTFRPDWAKLHLFLTIFVGLGVQRDLTKLFVAVVSDRSLIFEGLSRNLSLSSTFRSRLFSYSLAYCFEILVFVSDTRSKVTIRCFLISTSLVALYSLNFYKAYRVSLECLWAILWISYLVILGISDSFSKSLYLLHSTCLSLCILSNSSRFLCSASSSFLALSFWYFHSTCSSIVSN